MLRLTAVDFPVSVKLAKQQRAAYCLTDSDSGQVSNIGPIVVAGGGTNVTPSVAG